ncbi:MAG: PP2C family protein-serine/threonine phosphatase [Burkholderiales bacterium]
MPLEVTTGHATATGPRPHNEDFVGMATTLTALVLRGRRAVFAHIGDTRAYRLRNGTLQRLTVDHVWDRPDMAHGLKRAVGLDRALRADYGDVDIDAGDRFILICDGVWSVLPDDTITRLSADHREPQALADADRRRARSRHGGQRKRAVRRCSVCSGRRAKRHPRHDGQSAGPALPETGDAL